MLINNNKEHSLVIIIIALKDKQNSHETNQGRKEEKKGKKPKFKRMEKTWTRKER